MGLFEQANLLNQQNASNPNMNLIKPNTNALLGTSPNQVNLGNVATPPVQGPLLPNGQFNSGQGGAVLGAAAAAAPNYGVYGSAGGQSSALALIDQAYTDANTGYNNQINETTAGRDLNLERLGTSNQQALSSVNEAQTGQINDLNQSANTVKQGSTNAVNDARRAYNELQQRNNAQLSASGLSSSSVAEALGEQLSRSTFSALDQISQNRDAALQNIEATRNKATEFYARQRTELATALDQAKKEVNIQFQSAINRINEAKSLTEQQRQQARNQVYQGAQQAFQAAQAKAAEYQQAMDLHNNVTNQTLAAINGYTQGKYSPDQVLQNISAINQKLKASNSGLQIDPVAAINHAANPYSTTSFLVQSDPNLDLINRQNQAQTKILEGQANQYK